MDDNMMRRLYSNPIVSSLRIDLQKSTVVNIYTEEHDFRKIRKIFDQAEVDIKAYWDAAYEEDKFYRLVVNFYQHSIKNQHFTIQHTEDMPHIMKSCDKGYIFEDVNGSIIHVQLE